MMDHIEKNKLVLVRQCKIMNDFIKLIINDDPKILNSLYQVIIDNNGRQLKGILDCDKLSDANDFIRNNFLNIIQHGFINPDLLNPEYCLFVNLKLGEFLNHVKNIEFTNERITLVKNNVPMPFFDFNTKTFSLVYNNSDVKKLLGLNPFSELPYLSDDEFNTFLQNAITIVKTIELFD